jgi:hypothetical protein
MSVHWDVTPDVAWEGAAKLQAQRIEQDIVKLIESLLEQAQGYMRENARWQDISGDARSGLYTDIEMAVREFADLVMSHGPAIPYAWDLETVSNGRYAILGDTYDHFAPLIYREVSAIIRRHSS